MPVALLCGLSAYSERVAYLGPGVVMSSRQIDACAYERFRAGEHRGGVSECFERVSFSPVRAVAREVERV